MTSTTSALDGLALAREKMARAQVHPAAIDVFARFHAQIAAGETGVISEEDVRPLVDVDDYARLAFDPAAEREALAATVVIKLNGGLGTSMGMDKAKSLLPVRGELSFLDVIVGQVRAARARHDIALPLVLMNSFRTRADTLAALEAHPDLAVAGLPVDFLQNAEPKLRADDLTPVEWPADPDLEWCPPGHGDLYTALHASGILERLLAAGFRYASVSNSDNLGAEPDGAIAAWFAASGAPFAAEVAKRTPADRKGGHLVVRRADGRIVLRETAQTRPEDACAAADISTHRYFNTNNLWMDLRALTEAIASGNGVLPLPVIRNAKTVDPSDKTSTPVIQIESAMGAAIEVFDGARVILTPRSRFLPVKTTDDLLVLRSDVYELDDQLSLRARRVPPLVSLGERYRLVGDFDARFPHGVPSLRAADSLTVEGDWFFGSQVRAVGEAVLEDAGEPHTVPDGAEIGPNGVRPSGG